MISACIGNHMASKVWDEITVLFPNFSGCTVEVSEWKGNLTLHIMMDTITYPFWEYVLTLFVKGAQD